MLTIEIANNTQRESIRHCFLTLFDAEEEKYFNEIKDLSMSYIAIDRLKQVKAFILVNKSTKYANYEIAFLGVSPRYRRKGYAKILIKLVLRNLQESAWLNTLENNNVACTLYETLGFKKVDKFQDKNGATAIVYVIECENS